MGIGRQSTLAVTLGDPAGVGPEVALAAIDALRRRAGDRPLPRLLLVGDAAVAAEAVRRRGLRLRLAECTHLDLAAALAGAAGRGAPVPILHPGEGPPMPALRAVARRPGRPSLDGSRLAYESIRTAVALARDGVIDGLCTAPISKEWFDRAGVARTGHTEILAELSGARCVRLMMALDRLRVVLATSHVALRDVPAALSIDGIFATIEVTARHLSRWWGISRPRIAVAALNPHASDGGVYGDEEERVIAPAIRRARDARVDAVGPVPADTLFSSLGPRCDAVVAMYHDQGLIPIKQLDVHRAVNVTLGLPFVRTSPDHGTGFDLAGRGRPDPGSMRSALELALSLVVRNRRAAARRNPASPRSGIAKPRKALAR